jgi:hypothetical protein
MIDDIYLSMSLDEQWRSPLSIKRLMKSSVPPENISAALRRLAKAGRIEKQEQPLGVRHRINNSHHRLGAPLVIELYRKLGAVEWATSSNSERAA